MMNPGITVTSLADKYGIEGFPTIDSYTNPVSPTSGVPPVSTPPVTNEIAVQIQLASQEALELRAVVSSLITRLEPAMRPSDIDSAVYVADTGVKSPYANQIELLRDHMRDLRALLLDCMSRLET